MEKSSGDGRIRTHYDFDRLVIPEQRESGHKSIRMSSLISEENVLVLIRIRNFSCRPTDIPT